MTETTLHPLAARHHSASASNVRRSVTCGIWTEAEFEPNSASNSDLIDGYADTSVVNRRLAGSGRTDCDLLALANRWRFAAEHLVRIAPKGSL